MKNILVGIGMLLALTTGAFAEKSDKLFVDRYPQYEQRLDGALVLAQATAPTTTIETSAPVTSTTKVSGGSIAASILEWVQVAFGSIIGAAVLAIIVRGLQFFGIQLTAQNRAQLDSIVLNGINAASAKYADELRKNPSLDINVKSAVIADAIDYAQRHGPSTIKALGLDPQSGEAVEVIRARIETALNDPKKPTPVDITPPAGMPQVNGVVINGASV